MKTTNFVAETRNFTEKIVVGKIRNSIYKFVFL